jgi:hypothetical protein
MNALNPHGLELCMEIEGRTRHLQLRRHTGTNDRYHGRTQNDENHSVEFALIRTPVGRWVAGGDGLPDWINNNGALIARAILTQQQAST